MKFSTSRESLLKPLQAVIGVVERRQTMPVLANVLLVAKKNGLSVTATDLEVELVASAPIDSVDVEYDVQADRICVTVSVATIWKTGVEMEALTAASVAALTIYDMCKAVDRGMSIGKLELLHKEGGKSGVWQRSEG